VYKASEIDSLHHVFPTFNSTHAPPPNILHGNTMTHVMVQLLHDIKWSTLSCRDCHHRIPREGESSRKIKGIWREIGGLEREGERDIRTRREMRGWVGCVLKHT
jgi:hypothetical protein